jgi:uncharacterized protein (TIGR00369 family)
MLMFDGESPPPGFTELKPYGPFGDLVGPMYELQGSGGTVLGLKVEEKHRNRRQSVHGGMICTMVDTALAYAARRVLDGKLGHADFTLVTTQLSVSFIGNAPPGQWIEARVKVLRAGRRMAFTSCTVQAGDEVIAQAAGQFMVLHDGQPRS